jgi:guanylate kinase
MHSSATKPGKLIVFTAPSGSGKTSIAKAVLKERKDVQFSVSATTRQPRAGEIHAKDYYFLSPEAFQQHINEGDFVEWEEFYGGKRYGTLKEEVDRIRSSGNHVLFDVEVKGARSIKEIYGDQCLVIFVLPPSLEVLKERLTARATEDAKSLEMRLKRAEMELGYANEFDRIVKNNQLDSAISYTFRILSDFIGH